MRRPDETKKGLECCQLAFGFRECGSRCPYYKDSCCGALLAADALALIQKLEAQNAELRKRQNALKEVARGNCEWCKHYDFGQESDICKKCVHFSWENDPDDNWELEDPNEGANT